MTFQTYNYDYGNFSNGLDPSIFNVIIRAIDNLDTFYSKYNIIFIKMFFTDLKLFECRTRLLN